MYAPTMPQTAPFPVFASANQATESEHDWHIDTAGDPMDFDLLAEYLLDDNTANPAGIGFDFQ